MRTTGHAGRPDPDRLAGELGLGTLQRRHRTMLWVHLAQLVFGVLALAGTCLLVSSSLQGTADLPWWAGILIGALSLAASLVLLRLGWEGLRERPLLLRHEQGLIEVTRTGMQAIRWDDVAEVLHSPEQWFATGGLAVRSGPFLTLVDAAGQRLHAGPDITRQAELIQAVREIVVPRLRDRFRRVLDGGGQVRFGPLTVGADGLETEDGLRRLAWAEVTSVSLSGDGVRIRAKGKLPSWFDGTVPNADVLVAIAQDR